MIKITVLFIAFGVGIAAGFMIPWERMGIIGKLILVAAVILLAWLLVTL